MKSKQLVVRFVLGVGVIVAMASACTPATPTEICKPGQTLMCRGAAWQACEQDDSNGNCTALYLKADDEQFACTTCTDCKAANMSLAVHCNWPLDVFGDGGAAASDDSSTSMQMDVSPPPKDTGAASADISPAGPAADGVACTTSSDCANNCCDGHLCRTWASGAMCACKTNVECAPLTKYICGGDGGPDVPPTSCLPSQTCGSCG